MDNRKKILFICAQQHFLKDVEQNFMLASLGIDWNDDYDLICRPDSEDLNENISIHKPDIIVITYDVLKKRESWDIINTQIVFIAHSEKELQEGARYGLKTYGVVKTSMELIKKLSDSEPYEMQPKNTKAAEKKAHSPQKEDDEAKKKVLESKSVESKKIDTIEKLDGLDDIISKPYTGSKNDIDSKKIGNVKKTNQTTSMLSSGYGQELPMLDFENEYDPIEADNEDEISAYSENTNLYEESYEDPFDEENDAPEEENAKQTNLSHSIHHVKNKDHTDYIGDAFRHDLRSDKGKTKVITVYSAKGGVGKTTVASELATYLSLVNIGQRKLRVCLVDYNIDFGNVWATLAIPQSGSNLAYWAAEVQELLQNGKLIEDIRYSQKEIEEYLRRDKKSGLYVLPAPFTHEDSMSIESEALNIILYNLVEFGNFDYIICDTGNNTRDSTMIALEYADNILMIMTQNVNTAICDKAFMKTMDSIDFDLSNVKLVINYIMPQKSTGMSVQEIVDYFPYDCVGKIRFNADIIRATNEGKPLAFDPNHDFTKQMRSIVSYILQNNEFEVEQKPKKKLFGFLFKK